jgi:hypothetical protein
VQQVQQQTQAAARAAKLAAKGASKRVLSFADDVEEDEQDQEELAQDKQRPASSDIVAPVARKGTSYQSRVARTRLMSCYRK